MTERSHRRQLLRVSASLESLRSELQQDLAAMRQLPEDDLAWLLRVEKTRSCVRMTRLLRRLEALKAMVEVRTRELQRLRARMHQLHGGARPH